MPSRFIQKKKQKIILKKRFKGPTPDGIDHTIGISEETRDRLKKRDWSGPLKRTLKQRDPSTLTTKELQEIHFSGIRYDQFTNRGQIWVDGVVRAEAPADAIAKNPAVLAEMMERVFGIAIAVDVTPDRGKGDSLQ